MRESPTRKPSLVRLLHPRRRAQTGRDDLETLNGGEGQRGGSAGFRVGGNGGAAEELSADLVRSGEFRCSSSASNRCEEKIREGERSPLLRASTVSPRTRPELAPIIPRPTVSSSIPVSSSGLPNSILFCSLRNSVCAYASFCFRALQLCQCKPGFADCLPLPTPFLPVRFLRDGQRFRQLVGRRLRHLCDPLLQIVKRRPAVRSIPRALPGVDSRR